MKGIVTVYGEGTTHLTENQNWIDENGLVFKGTVLAAFEFFQSTHNNAIVMISTQPKEKAHEKLMDKPWYNGAKL